ncbi:MAG: hypothetical protein IH950_10375 [Bacteroidetes bacterium]|nr:hypothetical protein [Bacteroidota bacterium]MCH8034142.1 hypothetical protein [Bacteroidota bacterium]
MFKYFPNKNPFYIIKNFFLVLILISGIIFPQTKTNLEVFYSLNDSLVNRIAEDIPQNNDKIILTLNLGNSYSIFSNHIKNDFIKKGKEIFTIPPGELNLTEINIVLEEAGVKYGELDRDGWFGDYYVPRTLLIKGHYLNTASNNGLQQFFITAIDTVKVEELESLENKSFPFTKGIIPTEPFLSSVWEPVIAIGVAAAAILLFFSIRSK